MGLNDLYELSLDAKQNGQTVTNVFYYHQALEFVTSNPTKAQTLCENFIAQKLPKIKEIQIAELVNSMVRVRNLYNASDAYDQSISVAGAHVSTQDSLPMFSAVSFDLNGDNPAVKNGKKRFAGLHEGQQVDGVITESSTITRLGELADALETPVTVGTVIQDPVFIHVIVKRIRSGSPGAYEYRLPNNALEATLSAVVVAAFKALITSQISRKIGVGA